MNTDGKLESLGGNFFQLQQFLEKQEQLVGEKLRNGELKISKESRTELISKDLWSQVAFGILKDKYVSNCPNDRYNLLPILNIAQRRMLINNRNLSTASWNTYISELKHSITDVAIACNTLIQDSHPSVDASLSSFIALMNVDNT